MTRTELQDIIRIFFWGVLGLILLYIAALVTSFVGSFGQSAPDAAYGIEEIDYGYFGLPEDPVMEIWAWQKEETEKRELVMLRPRTVVNSGPSVSWMGGLLSVYGTERLTETLGSLGASTDFASELPFEMNGLTLSVQGEGQITARWEHVPGSDCGFSHTWWFSEDRDLTGGLDKMRLNRNHTAEAQGTNSLCLLWAGQGGYPSDTLDAHGYPADCGGHNRTTLAESIGEDEEGYNTLVTRDSMSILIHLECRDLLGRLLATATVRAVMTSGWRGAGMLYNVELPAIEAAESRGEEAVSRWIDYAVQPPTWTVELVAYRER